jgi:serine/threonine-protein kinase
MRPGSLILTQEGMVFGTPEFMSPEQAQGKTLTPGSDIYSLAVILYEVLTGKLPFEAKNPMEYIQLHVTAKPKPINERVPGKTFPPLLWTVLEKALAKKVEDRYPSAAEFAHALQAVLQGLSEVPPFPGANGAARAMIPGQPLPTPVHPPPANPPPQAQGAAQAPSPKAVTAAPLSTPLPRPAGPTKTPIGMLIGVAVAFLIVGAILAAVVMKLVLK